MTRNRGFSLLEILIVVMILGILAAIVVPRFSGATGQAYDVTARSFERSLQNAASLYFSKTKRMPTSFYNFVNFGGSGSEMNYISITGNLRSLFADPQATVATDDRTLDFTFKNGLRARYTIDADSVIRGTYTGP